MKTGRDATRSGLYVSECCLKECHCLEGQMLPRCPSCCALTVWELEEFETGDNNETQLTYIS
jgi:hypothetical protein